MKYDGPDRRVHKVYITKHTEYHVRDGEVIAVRPRGTKLWLEDHNALHMKIQGKIVPGAFLPQPGPPRPGERIYMATQENDVVTSPIVAIVRPPRNTVAAYPLNLSLKRPPRRYCSQL